MKKFVSVVGLGLALTLSETFVIAPVTAAQLFQAILDSDQEVFPAGQTNSPATGFANLELNDAGTELAYSITVFGIDFNNLASVSSPSNPLDIATGLHFHQAPRGVNGSVVFGIFGPAQDLDDRVVTFNSVDESTTISGVWDLDDQANISLSNFVPSLLATKSGEDTGLYLNLHSIGDRGGLIRGQIVAASVPEPTSLAGLLAFGAISATCVLKKKKTQ